MLNTVRKNERAVAGDRRATSARDSGTATLKTHHLCRNLKEWMSEPHSRSRGSIFCAEGTQAKGPSLGGSVACPNASTAGSVAGRV